ncbi:MAG: glycosyltransferase [Chitinophagales bacterium]|nr:glycosyltransferase [Chitinophagales bacterium]
MHTLAIFSPNQNAYSETFIQAHRQLPFDIRFYYGDFLPSGIENGSMIELPMKLRVEKKILKGFSSREKKLMFSLKKEKVDVVLAEYGQTAAETLKVLNYLKLPLVVHFHGYDASVKEITENYRPRYREVFEFASSIIAVSTKMKEDLIALGCVREKIVLNPYGPNPSFCDLQPKYHSPQFIAIGRFVEKKAPHLTIFSFRKVLDKFLSAELVMVGDGPLLPVCKDLVNALGISENIKFTGVKSAEEVRKLMESSLAFVQHSVIAENGDSEGTPVAVLEAQAAALPVIATEHAGIPDVVLHNQTGLLCKEKDIEAMAANMLRILQEDGLAERLGTAGRKRIQKHFTMERHLQILTDCINRAVKQ